MRPGVCSRSMQPRLYLYLYIYVATVCIKPTETEPTEPPFMFHDIMDTRATDDATIVVT